MTPREFRNIFALLRNLDKWDMDEAGVLPPGEKGREAWDRFNRDPVAFILKLDDDRLASLHGLVESRQARRTAA